MVVEYQEEYIRNARGVQLFTCRWLPFSSPKALVFLCHGYGMECSGFMRGYQVLDTLCLASTMKGMDDPEVLAATSRSSKTSLTTVMIFLSLFVVCENHDTIFISPPLDPQKQNVNLLKYDYCDFPAQEEYRDKGRFLYGESMGGAVSLLLHKKDPPFWNGAVLVAPMCKISEKVKPHPVVVNILTKIEEIIPKWKIVPTKDVIDSAFKDPVKREEIRSNKLIYQDKPRLKTALEMLRTSISLEESLNKVTLPFFVLHGEADTVTDPEVSKALYTQAGSRDKTIKLYPGMWHGLTSGEPDDNIDIVFADIIAWLDKHTSNATAIVVTPIHFSLNNCGVQKLMTTDMDSPGRKQQQYRSYLCGLKGRRMFHHSAM
ncbi:hypothetical protein Ddye_016977 [Dipteronia dyeriana]|uniref:Serine aminopeptidase S33 domain-containing protein n=1 Tax=Dipteronia dyeriana TaxID=168575 RepID=A0AAD9X0K0_9ROSI|nr:hypothetical protein Ddye_016977 [Dipteronia dyeriana]